jgi:hypothetical protein
VYAAQKSGRTGVDEPECLLCTIRHKSAEVGICALCELEVNREVARAAA